MDKLDFSKPDQLQTRDGRQVRIYATDGACSYCIHGAILTERGWEANVWDRNGRYVDDKKDNSSDLVRKTRRITGWVNVYQQPSGVYATSNVFESQIEARKASSCGCFGQIYIDAEVQE